MTHWVPVQAAEHPTLTMATSHDTTIDQPENEQQEQEEKARLITQVLELQNTLSDLSCRVDNVKEENLRLRSENQVDIGDGAVSVLLLPPSTRSWASTLRTSWQPLRSSRALRRRGGTNRGRNNSFPIFIETVECVGINKLKFWLHWSWYQEQGYTNRGRAETTIKAFCHSLTTTLTLFNYS